MSLLSLLIRHLSSFRIQIWPIPMHVTQETAPSSSQLLVHSSFFILHSRRTRCVARHFNLQFLLHSSQKRTKQLIHSLCTHHRISGYPTHQIHSYAPPAEPEPSPTVSRPCATLLRCSSSSNDCFLTYSSTISSSVFSL
jgi:hypothetical protein